MATRPFPNAASYRAQADGPQIPTGLPWTQALESGDLSALEAVYLDAPTQLPPELRACQRLRFLTVRNGELKRLPDFVFELPLEGLSIFGTELTTLPPSIARAKELRALELSANKLRGIPPEVGALTHLERLDLSFNTLSREGLPDSLGDLTALRTLSLSETQLTSLPDCIGDLRNLRHLSVAGSPKLSTLPDALARCAALTTLDAANCKRLERLPNALFPELAAFEVEETKLKAIPDGYLTSAKLAWVDLSGVPLKEVPSSLRASATTLEMLRLSSCRLSKIPDWVGELRALYELDLSNNRLKTLPPSIGALTELDTLRLGWNPISALPPELGRLTRLTRLHAGYCGLETLPDTLADLSALTHVEIQNNAVPLSADEIRARYFPRAELEQSHLYQKGA